MTTSSGSTAPSSVAPGGPAGALEQAFVAVVAKVRPEVVEISTDAGLGSGVVYDSQGDIVTNDHVVGAATSFEVKLVNGQSLPATLVGAYPPDDLAVIKVKGGRALSPASFGDSAHLQVGDIVFAVGNPLGLASSVTEGIVSYNGRSVGEGNGVELPQTIQTSAAINPGNSGGALVDLAGQVVGIPTLAAVDQQVGGAAAGIGFAIPSNTVKLIAPQLIASGHVTNSGRAGLGISGSDATDPLGNPVGVIVVAVQPGGAAAKAGIVAGDVITSVDNQPVSSLADLQNVLAGLTPGATAQVQVLRQDGTRRTFSVTLGQLTA
ncbi:MAG TPA: trypsin-like peptidase domain-containing protein [Acidimicrobiales bacterium]|nr:trypsin-like peptidase domain-containing protein [Acidimicrobiales bacterium]